MASPHRHAARLPSRTTASHLFSLLALKELFYTRFSELHPQNKTSLSRTYCLSVCVCAAVTHTRALCLTDRELFSALPESLGTGTHTYFPTTSASVHFPLQPRMDVS